jgi:hypothetical protein
MCHTNIHRSLEYTAVLNLVGPRPVFNVFWKYIFIRWKPLKTVENVVEKRRFLPLACILYLIEWHKIEYFETFSFRWIIHFWYFWKKSILNRGYLYTAFLSKVSKVDCPSKAIGWKVRGVCTFFVTCLNLGQLFPYNFKTLYIHFSRNFNQKLWPYSYSIELFDIIFII